MRRRLYRPGASSTDLASYLQVVGDGTASAERQARRALGAEPVAQDPETQQAEGQTPEPPEPETPERRPAGRSRRWPIVAGTAVGGVIVAALVGGVLASGHFAPSQDASPRTSGASTSTSGPRPAGGALTGIFEDGGARATASGTAAFAGPMGSRLSDSGASAPAGQVRYLYAIAAGDTVYGITTRFGLCSADVIASAPYGFDWATPAPGTVLLLQRTATFPSRNATGTC